MFATGDQESHARDHVVVVEDVPVAILQPVFSLKVLWGNSGEIHCSEEVLPVVEAVVLLEELLQGARAVTVGVGSTSPLNLV